LVKKRKRIILTVFLLGVLLVSGLFLSLQYSTIQTWLAQRATAFLSDKLGTKVSIERVSIQFFHRASFKNFYVQDLNSDTLFYAKELNIGINAFSLWNKKLLVNKVTLDRVKFYLHTDSTGKRNNLNELLAKIASAPKKIDTTVAPSKFTWHIDLKNLTMNDADVRVNDEKAHLDLRVLLPELTVSLDKADLLAKQVLIKKILIAGVDVAIDLAKRPPKIDDTVSVVHFLPAGWRIAFNELDLHSGKFSLYDHNSDTIRLKGIDFKHLDVRNISLCALNGVIEGDTILANITSMNARERSGFKIDELVTNARVATNGIVLDNLLLKTQNSEIKNYLSFTFNEFGDFKDFFNAVRLKANLSSSRLSLKDLNYFITKLDMVEHNVFRIDGEIDGKISSLRGKAIRIATGNNTVFEGDFYARGLPKPFETSLNLRIRTFTTNTAEVQRIYPKLKLPPNLQTLGQVFYSGRFDGFVTDFVTDGKLSTAIGSATTDINFKYEKKNNKSAYEGNIALNKFNLGKYFKDEKNLGEVSLVSKIKGGGLTLESLKAQLEGNVTSIVLRDYNYQEIKLDGLVQGKSFSGKLKIDDENLKMDFEGAVDLSQTLPEFRFSSIVNHIDLQALNLGKLNLAFAGNLNANFSGNKIDNITGSLDLSNLRITRDDTIQANVDRLHVEAINLPDQTKSLQLFSDVANIDLTGKFTVNKLSKSLVSFGKNVFTKDYVDTSAVRANQDFELNITLFDLGQLTRVFIPKFYSIDYATLSAKYNSENFTLSAKANVPDLRYDNFKAKDLNLYATSQNAKFDFHTSLAKLLSKDSVLLDTLDLTAQTVDDKDIKLSFLGVEKSKKNYANVTAFLTRLKGKSVIQMEPSDVKLANYNWHFGPNNYIFVEGKKIVTRNLVFQSEEQRIYINSYLKNDTSTSIRLTLDNTSVADFTGIFSSKIKDLSGSMNGYVAVEDVFYKPKVFADFVIDQFMLGKELVGDVNVESVLDETGKNIRLYASVKSYTNLLEARGNISLAGKDPYILVNITSPRFGLNFLNYRFFDKYVSNVRGFARLNAELEGPLKKPLLTGEVVLVNDTVTVPFLNTTYSLKEQRVTLDEHGFNFDYLKASDVRGRELTAFGRINHEGFKFWNIDLTAQSENAQFLNTTEKNNPNFYGVAYAKGRVSFLGPFNNIVIKGYAKTLPGTYCKLPIVSSYETNKYSFYKFVDKLQDSTVKAKMPLKLNGVTFILDVDITPDARMDIILDPQAGDVLTGYGSGNLKVILPKIGSFGIFGSYEIDRGDYLFTLQNIINKKFVINKGGSINFTGDVYKAALDIDAVYQVRASVTDLIDDLVNGNTGQSTQNSQLTNTARSRIPINLLLNLTGVLERPNVSFGIQAIDPDPTIKGYVDQKLALLRNNENQLNNQVFGLLVMNRFLPSTDALRNVNYGGTAANTVSEFVSSQLSNYLSSLLGYANVKDLDINIGYRQYDDLNSIDNGTGATPLTSQTRRELQLALSQKFLNNRLSLNAGGNLDFGSAQVTEGGGARAVIPTGDFQIEYTLTPDGAWRAKAFNKTNYDYYNSRNTNRTGVGISYRKEFDKASDLFKKKKSKKKKATEKTTEADKPKEPEANPKK